MIAKVSVVQLLLTCGGAFYKNTTRAPFPIKWCSL